MRMRREEKSMYYAECSLTLQNLQNEVRLKRAAGFPQTPAGHSKEKQVSQIRLTNHHTGFIPTVNCINPQKEPRIN